MARTLGSATSAARGSTKAAPLRPLVDGGRELGSTTVELNDIAGSCGSRR